jgi:uncharacterized membrane protein YtjA (UPF0391 family)
LALPDLTPGEPAVARRVFIPGSFQETDMLSWALIFFVVAIIAAVFGFGGIASASAGIAQILFFIFLVLFVVSLIMGMARRG